MGTKKGEETKVAVMSQEEIAAVTMPEATADEGMDIDAPRMQFNKLKIFSSPDKQMQQFGIVDEKKQSDKVAKLVAKKGDVYIYDHESKPFGISDLLEKYSGVVLKIEKGCEFYEKAMVGEGQKTYEGWKTIARFKTTLSKDQKIALVNSYLQQDHPFSIVDTDSINEETAMDNKKLKEAGLQIVNQISVLLAPEDFRQTEKMIKDGLSPFVRVVVQGLAWENWFAMPNRLQKRLRESELYPNVDLRKAKAPWFTMSVFSEHFETDNYGKMHRFNFDAEVTPIELAAKYMPFYEQLKGYSHYDWEFNTDTVELARAIQTLSYKPQEEAQTLNEPTQSPREVVYKSSKQVMQEKVQQEVEQSETTDEDDLPF